MHRLIRAFAVRIIPKDHVSKGALPAQMLYLFILSLPLYGQIQQTTIFSNFSLKQDLTFHANCLRTGKNKKILPRVLSVKQQISDCTWRQRKYSPYASNSFIFRLSRVEQFTDVTRQLITGHSQGKDVTVKIMKDIAQQPKIKGMFHSLAVNRQRFLYRRAFLELKY